ncbi:MAG: hypothetical protein EOP04_11805, partial [Proteobacteria bacterium]
MKFSTIVLLSTLLVTSGCLKEQSKKAPAVESEKPKVLSKDTPVQPTVDLQLNGKVISGRLNVDLNLTNPGQALQAPIFIDVQPIFQKDCVSCHAAEGSGRLDLRNFPSSSTSSRTAILQKIKLRMNDAAQPMPPKSSGGLLTQQDRQLVANWVDGGALEAYPNLGSEQDYSGYKAKIRTKDEQGLTSSWQELAEFVAGKANVNLGELKVGSNV